MAQLLKTIDELEAQAKAATPGKRSVSRDHDKDGNSIVWIDTEATHGSDNSHVAKLIAIEPETLLQKLIDAEYIAACSPDVILQLCTALREAHEVIEFYANHENWLREADSDVARRINGLDCSTVERYAEFCGGRKAREFREKWDTPSKCE